MIRPDKHVKHKLENRKKIIVKLRVAFLRKSPKFTNL